MLRPREVEMDGVADADRLVRVGAGRERRDGSTRDRSDLSVGGERRVGAALSRQPPAHGSAGSPTARESDAAAARQASSGISARSVQSSGGQIRSSVSVRASPVEDHRLADEPAQEAQVRDDAQDDGLVERACQPSRAVGAVRTPGDDLGQHRVEAVADLGPELDPGIDPDPLAGRPAEPSRPDRSPGGSRPRRPRRRGGPRPRDRSVGRSSAGRTRAPRPPRSGAGPRPGRDRSRAR